MHLELKETLASLVLLDVTVCLDETERREILALSLLPLVPLVPLVNPSLEPLELRLVFSPLVV